MQRDDWLTCTNPIALLDLMPYRVSKRKWRLMAVAFCRRLWHLLSDERSRQAVEAAERWADGLIRHRELKCAQDAVPVRQINSAGGKYIDGADGAAFSAASPTKRGTASSARHAVWALEAAGASIEVEMSYQCHLIRDIVGYPYRSVSIDPVVLAWNDGAVRRIAQAIYAERLFADLPILADALEDAGCDNEELIQHCRSEGPHVRGCWAVDRILGME